MNSHMETVGSVANGRRQAPSFLKQSPNGTLITCRIQPKASKTAIVGIYGDSLKICIAAAPEDGEANRELREFLRKIFDIPKSSVEIISGGKSRTKILLLKRVSADKVLKFALQN